MDDWFGHAEGLRSYHSGSAGRVLGDEAASSAAVVLRDYAVYYAAPAITENATSRETTVITFITGRYRPPHRVSMRCSPDWTDIDGAYDDGCWSFNVGGEDRRNGFHIKAVLDGAVWMTENDWWAPGLGRQVRLTDEFVHFGYTISLKTTAWAPNHLVTLRTDVDGWERDVFGVYEGGRWRFTIDAARYPSDFMAKFVVDRRWFRKARICASARLTTGLSSTSYVSTSRSARARSVTAWTGSRRLTPLPAAHRTGAHRRRPPPDSPGTHRLELPAFLSGEQSALTRLSVFPDTFDLEAAEAVMAVSNGVPNRPMALTYSAGWSTSRWS